MFILYLAYYIQIDTVLSYSLSILLPRARIMLMILVNLQWGKQ